MTFNESYYDDEQTCQYYADCEDYHQLVQECWCSFSRNTSSCELDDVFVQYVHVFLCKEMITLAWIIGMNIVYALWAVYLFVALGITADAFFVPALTHISDNLHLSDNVAGVTLVALGNGAPDIFSAVAAFTADEEATATMAIGSLLGAGMFVIMVVGGSCMIIKPFEIASWSSLRDIITYLWALFWLIRCIYRGYIGLFDSIGFLVLYIIYVTFVIVQDKFFPDVINDDNAPVEIDNINFDNDAERVSIQSIDSVLRHTSFLVGNRVRAASFMSLDSDQGAPRSRSGTGVSNGKANANRGGGIGNPAFLSADYQPQTRRYTVDQTPEDSDTNEKVYIWKSEAKAAFLPWDAAEFADGNRLDKFIAIMMSPLVFLLKITCPVVDRDDLQGSWNKPLALSQAVAIPWLWYILLKQYEEPAFGDVFPRYACAIIGSVCLAVPLHLTSSLEKAPFYLKYFVYIAFFNCILWIFTEANEVVGLLTALGIMWGVPQAIMGLTFLAWANSVGDLVADLSLARIGKAQTAVAACFGTPLLNLLVGTGIGCTMGILTTEGREDGIHLFLGELNMTLLAGICFILLVLLFVLPLGMRTFYLICSSLKQQVNFKVAKRLGIAQLTIYLAFLVLCVVAVAI